LQSTLNRALANLLYACVVVVVVNVLALQQLRVSRFAPQQLAVVFEHNNAFYHVF